MTITSTSMKHNNFVNEPMGDKEVTELAGISEMLGERLNEAGYDKAYVLLGRFLVLKKDKELFKNWMKEVCQATTKQAHDCHKCLSDWCEGFL